MKVTLDITELEDFTSRIQEIQDPAELITQVFHEYGVEKVENEITKLLPMSGRHWKGKATAAKNAQPFKSVEGKAYFEVKSQGKYHYLYFPDDGSNTKRHRGHQEFMLHGAETAQQDIIDKIIEKMIQEIEQGAKNG